MKSIRLPEHWSSRLLFIENNILNSGQAELKVEGTDEVKDENNTNNYDCDCSGIINRFIVGKLNNYIWLLEDCATYDTNHRHTGNLYYIDPTSGEKVILYHITRDMEYGSECDRMYTQYGGSNKVLILGKDYENLSANFYLKYEKNIPTCKDEVELVDEDDEQKYYIYLYNYNSSNQIGIIDTLVINNKLEDIDNRLFTIGDPTDKLKILDIDINDVKISTSQLSIKYNIQENNTNDFRIGIISVDSLNDKFISNYIKAYAPESTYFFIQPPINRSWIYFRLLSTEHDIGNPYSYIMGHGYTENGDYVYFYNLSMDGLGLTGKYGEFDNENNTYTYEIELDRSTNSIGNYFLLPIELCDYQSLTFYNSNGEEISWDIGGKRPGEYIYNLVDSTLYKEWWFYHTTSISKIKLVYKINNEN